MKFFKKSLAVGALLALSGAANAGTYTFDFTTGGTTEGNGSLTFLALGSTLSVNIEGWHTPSEDASGPWTNDNNTLTTGPGGIGYDRGETGTGNQVDGLGNNELLKFIFSPATSLVVNTISFTAVGSNDDFSLFADQDGDGFVSDDPILGHFDIPGSGTFTFNPALAQTPFGVGAGFGVGSAFSNDDFRVSGLTVTVPEPATWLMMIIGFAVIGLMHKRRQPKRVLS